MPALLHLLIWLIAIGAIFYLLYWLVGQIPLPAPFAVIARCVLAIFAVIVLIELILPLAGSPPLLR